MDQVQPTGCFHLLYQLFSREREQLFEQLIAAGRAKHFIMALSLPLLSQWEGRGKKQWGQTYLLCSANQKWLAEHNAAPIQREGEMVPLQSSKITVLPKRQQHETQEEARAYAGNTRQSHEPQFFDSQRVWRQKLKSSSCCCCGDSDPAWKHTSSKHSFLIKCRLIPPFLPITNNICHCSSTKSWKIQQI